MSRIRWYVTRARAMSPRELLHRCSELGLKKYSRVVPPRAVDRGAQWSTSAAALADHVLGWGNDPAQRAFWSTRAAALRDRGPIVFGQPWPLVGGMPDWHAALPTRGHWPETYCFNIDYRHANGGAEVRLTWELNRLFWLLPAAAHAVVEEEAELAEWCQRVVSDWMGANADQVGVNWASGIECALQVIALVTLEELIGRVVADHARRRSIAREIRTREAWIRRFPSRYSSANNHRIAELAGLIVAHAVLDGNDGRGAINGLADEFAAEYRRQHAEDGLNAELAPHYGVFVVELACICASACEEVAPEAATTIRAAAHRSANALRALTDSSGHLLCFGDDDGSALLSSALAPGTEVEGVLRWGGADPMGASSGESLVTLGDSWYSVMRSDDPWGRSQWTMDHAPLGFGALAAHGHADTLAVWLSVDGRPVFVEAGTYAYHSDATWRNFFRSTRVHNTLVVEATDSSTMSGAFNWDRASRANGRLLRRSSGRNWSVEADHDGYLRAFGCRHVRTLQRVAPGHFAIIDKLTGPEAHAVRFGLLLAPDIHPRSLSRGWELVRDGGSLGTVSCAPGFTLRTLAPGEGAEGGWVSPSFFQRVPSWQLVVEGDLGGERALRVDIRAGAAGERSA
ncbi:MAG: heparinase II/III family protein [Acidimicrobiales bacterium]